MVTLRPSPLPVARQRLTRRSSERLLAGVPVFACDAVLRPVVVAQLATVRRATLFPVRTTTVQFWAALCGLALPTSACAQPPASADYVLRPHLPAGYPAFNLDLQAQLGRILPDGTDLPAALSRLEAVIRHRRLHPQLVHGDRDTRSRGPGTILLRDQPYRAARIPATRFAKAPRLLTVYVDLGDFPYALGLLKRSAWATLSFDARQRLTRVEAHVSQGLP